MDKLLKVSSFARAGWRVVNYSEQKGTQFPVIRGDMLREDTFKGKTALVTGGGTGLGFGMSKKISSLGGRVVIASRKIDLLRKAAKEIQTETGNEVSGNDQRIRVNIYVYTSVGYSI